MLKAMTNLIVELHLGEVGGDEGAIVIGYPFESMSIVANAACFYNHKKSPRVTAAGASKQNELTTRYDPTEESAPAECGINPPQKATTGAEEEQHTHTENHRHGITSLTSWSNRG